MLDKYANLDDLLSADLREPLPYEYLNDAIWLLLSEKIHSVEDLEKYPPEVGVYYGSRLLQWEVGNGGFAQAAYNIPERFEIAAKGYETLGKPKAAALNREAHLIRKPSAWMPMCRWSPYIRRPHLPMRRLPRQHALR